MNKINFLMVFIGQKIIQLQDGRYKLVINKNWQDSEATTGTATTQTGQTENAKSVQQTIKLNGTERF
jgi:hypothetical protein